ncbi:MAG: HlyD family efflux transporter periplasmic adaptor subunit [Oscillospiraceae bacterium]|nr:HlyD family efflux transporter periplasmic adaptor subunit [Oscillospiraceae bacterium]
MIHILKKRRGLFIILGILAIIFLIVLFLPGPANVALGQESLRSVEVVPGEIATTVTGTGNLETEGGEAVMIPTGLTAQEVFVESGDLVSAGDVLAVFDLGSVQSRLADIYEELDELDGEIETARRDSANATITTRVAGRVESIFAEVDDSVTDTMLAHGALLTLALDGGETMEVTGTSGTISRVHVQEGDSVRAGATLFTLTELDVSSAYRAMVAERAELVETLRTLLALAETGELIAEFDGIVQGVAIGDSSANAGGAPPAGGGFPAGVPGGMFGFMNHTPSESSDAPGVVRLSNRTTAASETSSVVRLSDQVVPAETETTVITSLSGLSLAAPSPGRTPQRSVSGTGFTGTVQWQPADSTFGHSTVYRAMVVLTANSGFAFGQAVLNGLESQGFPATGASIVGVQTDSWTRMAITVAFPQTAAAPTPEPTPTPTPPPTPTPTPVPTPGQTPEPTPGQTPEPTPLPPGLEIPGGPGMPHVPGMPNMPGFSMPSFGGSMPGFAMPDMDMDAPGFPGMDAATANQFTAFSISRAYTMRLTVSVDERDILSLSTGQQAEVTLDAVLGETFEGEISRINTAGVATGGGARYTVEISLPRTDQMLPGMSASAVITTDRAYDILLIPAEALQEEGPRVFVYTGQEGNVPTDPVDVQTGLSDGVYVEIIAGLTAGDTVYYTVLNAPRWPNFGMVPAEGDV